MRWLLLLPVLLPSTAWALPWYVGSPDDASALRAALAELWPDAPVEVVEERALPGDALTLEDGVLRWVVGGEHREAAVADLPTAVVLARSWLRADPTWPGTAPEPVAPPAPEPVPVPVERPTWSAGIGVGAWDGVTTGRFVDGVRLGARAARAGLTLEGVAAFSAGGFAAVSSLDRRLAELTDGATVSPPVDAFTGTLLATLGPPPATTAWVAPRGVAGVELRQAVPRTVVATGAGVEVRLPEDRVWGGGPVLGGAVEGGVGRVAGRVVVVLRPHALGGAASLDAVGCVDAWIRL